MSRCAKCKFEWSCNWKSRCTHMPTSHLWCLGRALVTHLCSLQPFQSHHLDCLPHKRWAVHHPPARRWQRCTCASLECVRWQHPWKDVVQWPPRLCSWLEVKHLQIFLHWHPIEGRSGCTALLFNLGRRRHIKGPSISRRLAQPFSFSVSLWSSLWLSRLQRMSSWA